MKANTLGGSSTWYNFLHRQDFNNPRDLYKKVMNANASIMKDTFIDGNVHLEYKKFAEVYERNATLNSTGVEYLLMDKPSVKYVKSLEGWVQILADNVAFPMSKNIRLDHFKKLKILWTGEKSGMRFIQAGLSCGQSQELAKEYFRLVGQYSGPNFATFLITFGFTRRCLTKKFLGSQFKIGVLSYYGLGSTGKRHLSRKNNFSVCLSITTCSAGTP